MHELSQRLAPGGANRLAYHRKNFNIPDGRPCRYQLMVVRLADNTRTRIRCNAIGPAWSPKATRLLAGRPYDDGLIRIDLGTGKVTVVVRHALSGADWRPPH